MPASRVLCRLAIVVWEWYTKGMTSHRDCTHPATKAARARCRANKAKATAELAAFEAENKIYHDTYIRPYEEQEAARKGWEAECEKFCEAHIDSANQNADDTAHEEGFEPYSKRWYEIAISTLHHARDCADQNTDPKDPEKGQALQVIDRDDWYWVSNLKWANGWATKVEIIDREGNKEWIALDQIDS